MGACILYENISTDVTLQYSIADCKPPLEDMLQKITALDAIATNVHASLILRTDDWVTLTASRVQVDIPTCHFSERFLFRTVFIPNTFYSERLFGTGFFFFERFFIGKFGEISVRVYNLTGSN